MEEVSEWIDIQWFAAEDEGRTEEPTEYRLEKARKEGRVAKSQELSSALAMLFSITALWITSSFIFRSLVTVTRFFFSRVNADISKATLNSYMFNFMLIVAPIAVFSMLGAILSNLIQNRGMIFSLKPIEVKFSKIVPHFGDYFRRILFSPQGAFNVAKSLLKVTAVLFIIFILIRSNLPILLYAIRHKGVYKGISIIARIAGNLLLCSSLILLVISIPDYFVNRREFMESMKMTKSDVKQEYKELEGDPLVKQRLMAEARRILSQNIPKAVKEADVVITNPTHFAVAMKYDFTRAMLPEITAKGEDSTALFIKRLAKENNVPIVENRPLARALYAESEVGDLIPEKYIQIVATVYAKILSMK